LDEPIPSLGNQSPRKAAKTAKGREKVIAWLKMLENHSAQQGRDDPVGSYDFTWIWKELPGRKLFSAKARRGTSPDTCVYKY
jgi:hypothetical protein